MMSKTFYQLLEIPPAATGDEIKRAFRIQIARYHPDKVQHLGREFQDLAAERAAELTEAYRILSDEQRRASYDGRLASAGQTSAGIADRGSPSRNAAGHAAPAADPAAAPDLERKGREGRQETHSFASSAASAFNSGAENEPFSRER